MREVIYLDGSMPIFLLSSFGILYAPMAPRAAVPPITSKSIIADVPPVMYAPINPVIPAND